MISVSWYSLLSAIAIFSIALIAVYLLRKHLAFLKKHGVSILLLASALAILRLILPLDFPFTYVFESRVLIPAVRNLFRDHSWALTLLLAAWGIGAAVVLIKDIHSLIQAYAISENYVIVGNPRVEKIAADLSISCPVLVSPDVSVPYVSGLFRHKIYFPDNETLSDREIELILMHEVRHIWSHDSQIKLFWGLLSAVLWWNPIVYVFREEIDALLEFRCDANVMEHMDTRERTQYLDMLVNMAKQTADPPMRSALFLNESAALDSSNVFHQRFAVIMNNLNKESPNTSLWMKIGLIALFLTSYLVIWQPVGAAPVTEGESLMRFASGEKSISGEVSEFLGPNCIVKVDNKYYLVSEGRQGMELSPEEVFSETYKDYIILEECVP